MITSDYISQVAQRKSTPRPETGNQLCAALIYSARQVTRDNNGSHHSVSSLHVFYS